MSDSSVYRGDIRPSEVQALIERVQRDAYDKYLRRVTLKNARGFSEVPISFDSPVTALIGPNGGGKTTVLGAAAIAYKDVPPRRFFAKSGSYDASMQNWAIEFELRDKDLNPRLLLHRTASFPQLKWNRKALDRPVLIFGVSRTVPATERKELARAVGSTFSPAREDPLDAPVVDAVGRILAKPIDGYSRLFVDEHGRASLFAGSDRDGSQYSEFHFGAGEASIIRIVVDIESSPDNSLILIEEIENGLHPIATRRVVEYLMEVAQRKSCQVLFTTHSNDAIYPLPPEGIWAVYSGEALQGKLDIRTLRTITGQVDTQLAVFVEDEFAERMVETAIRYEGSWNLSELKVHGMGGASPAVTVTKQHNIDPTSDFPAVCFVDGDRQDLASHDESIFSLPGNRAPEAHVVDSVLSVLDTEVARLTLSMQLPSSWQSRVKEVVEERTQTNRDPHIVFDQIGDDLDFISGQTVRLAFLAIWAQNNVEEARSIVDCLPTPS